MNYIETLLTSEDIEDVRIALKEIIISQIKEDFENNDSYLVDPRQLEEIFEEILEEVKEEFKLIYKENIMRALEEKLSTW